MPPTHEPVLFFVHAKGATWVRLVKIGPNIEVETSTPNPDSKDLLGVQIWHKGRLDHIASPLAERVYDQSSPFEGFSRKVYDTLIMERDAAVKAKEEMARSLDETRQQLLKVEQELRPQGPLSRWASGIYR